MALVLFLAAPVLAQLQPPAEPGGGPTFKNPLLEEARLSERQAAILEILQTLKITTAKDQAKTMYGVMAELQRAQQTYANAIAGLVSQNLRFMQSYAQATLVSAPQAFDPAFQDQATGLVTQLGRARSDYETFCRQQYDLVYRTLTDKQRAAIETYEEAALKDTQAEIARTQGGSSVTEVVQMLRQARALDAASYQEQADGLAERVARLVVGRDPQLLADTTARARTVLDTIRGLQNDPSEAVLKAMIRQDLGLSEEGGPQSEDVVSQEGFENMLRDPVAYGLVGSLSGAADATGGGGQ
jgi:hypothetical protein